MDEYLTQVYYNPKRSGGLGGVERLYRDVKKDGKYDISRAQLKKWLMKQDTYTLHKPARRHYRRNRVIVGGIDELWQMDLADMQAIATDSSDIPLPQFHSVTSQTGSDVIVVNSCRFEAFFPTGSDVIIAPEVTSQTGSGSIVHGVRSFNPPHPLGGRGKGEKVTSQTR